MDVVLHALDIFDKYDYVLVLQPTSPLRRVQDIKNAIALMIAKRAPACVSISQVNWKPEWMFYIDENENLDKVIRGDSLKTRRQDLKKTFTPNGAIYLAKTSWLRTHKSFFSDETVGYVMPAHISVDIDEIADIKSCEKLLQQSKLI
jgi:N-acylneuraminate cytidylyltransferase